MISERAWKVMDDANAKGLSESMSQERCDKWMMEAIMPGRDLVYEARRRSGAVSLIKKPGSHAWDHMTVPFSMREVEPGVRLVYNDDSDQVQSKAYEPPILQDEENEGGDDE